MDSPACTRALSTAAALLASTVMTLVLSTQAHADDWGTETRDVGPHPDGGSTYWCLGSTIDPFAALTNAAEFVMDFSLGDPTHAISVYMARCDTTNSDGDGQTDVLWSQKDLGDGILGSNTCAAHWSGGTCDRSLIRLNDRVLRQAPIGYDLQANKTACHELGHAVGLAHIRVGDDCMDSGLRPDTSIQWVQYNGHHRRHIDDWF